MRKCENNEGQCMKIAIMQPYLFPYIGYWQLINAVDEFVLLDDVNYIMRGYINRNSILIHEKPFLFSISIHKASQNKLISETKLSFSDMEKDKFLNRIANAYKKAAQFEKVMPLIQEIVNNPEEDLTEYIYYQIFKINEYLHINTVLKKSSQIKKNNQLKAQDRIIDICKIEKADIYINPQGGRKLYNSENFKQQNIQLYFLDSRRDEIKYNQLSKEFVPSLSIIDVLMNASGEEIKKLLEKYDLNVN